MPKIIKILIDFLHKIGLSFGANSEQSAQPSPVEPQTDPKRGIIPTEPLLALEGGKLVMVVEHHFENVPSWVEWDKERQIVTITQMNGDLDEAKLDIKDEYTEHMEVARNLLLVSLDVSNDNEERIMHSVPILART